MAHTHSPYIKKGDTEKLKLKKLFIYICLKPELEGQPNTGLSLV